MNEHDNDEQPAPADPEPTPADREPTPADRVEPPPATPAESPKQRWRDRTFRMRSVAAVAVAGVILGAAGGAATTALVSGDGHGDRGGRHQIGQRFHPGEPMLPPGGRPALPGQPDDGTEEPSSLSQS